MKEAELLRQVMEYLTIIGLQPMRMSNHAVMRQDPRTGRAYHAFHGTRGMPDILVMLEPFGRALWIELKTASGKLSDDQRGFIDGARRRGAMCIVARTFEDVQDEIQRILSTGCNPPAPAAGERR